MLLLGWSGLLYGIDYDGQFVIGPISRWKLCCLDRLDVRDLRRSEHLDAFPIDDDDKTEARRCSVLITVVAFSHLVYDRSCFCRPLLSSLLLLLLLLLLVRSCNFEEEVAYRARCCTNSYLCPPRYVLIYKRMTSCDLLISVSFRHDSYYTWPKFGAFSRSTSE